MGLGRTGLKEARETAEEIRRQIRQGIDPIAARRNHRATTRSIPTFEAIAAEVIADAKTRSTNEKVRYQWELLLGPRYCDSILQSPINEITTLDIERVLRPVWWCKPETGRKLLVRLRRVFDYARVQLRDRTASRCCTTLLPGWTCATAASSAYSTNYLIDVDNAIIVDVEATTAIRQAEVLAAKRMIERSINRFDLYPARLLGDSAYGSAEMLGWLVYEHGIEPHVTVFDKSTRQDGTFSRDDFTYDHVGDVYSCPAGKLLTTTGSRINDGATLRYRASKYDCQTCRLKSRCCPKEPARYVPRSIYEGARDMARQIASSWEGHTARRLRKKVEMLFAHLKRILKLDRLRLRGPNGARDEFLLAATAQNLRKLAKLIPMLIPHPA